MVYLRVVLVKLPICAVFCVSASSALGRHMSLVAYRKRGLIGMKFYRPTYVCAAQFLPEWKRIIARINQRLLTVVTWQVMLE